MSEAAEREAGESQAEDLAARARARRLHLAEGRLWGRLSDEDPDGARLRYLQHQLGLSTRLSHRLAASVDAGEVAHAVVDELHETFNVFLAVVQRLDRDGVLRRVAAAGPLAEMLDGFLLEEQPISVGINGRAVRTRATAVIADTRLDPDYVVRDPESDPRSELAVPIVVDGTTWGVLNLEELDVCAFDASDVLLAEGIAAQLGAALHRCRLYADLEGAFMTTLGVLSDAVHHKDAYTADHEDDVAALADRVAERLGFAAAGRRAVRYAALLHDVGKVAIRTEIITKPGPLDEQEWAEMRQHTVIGAGMLARIPFFGDVHPLVRSSHERWDGGGYPDGLAADEIPLGARIVSACDAYDAMVTDRPYRAAMSPAAALAEMRRCAGTHFDARVVEALTAELG
jgi:putative nucleotidyltransferase with HDIG domain